MCSKFRSKTVVLCSSGSDGRKSNDGGDGRREPHGANANEYDDEHDENDEHGKYGLLTNLNNRNVIDNNKNIVMTIDKNINSYAENSNSKHPYLDRGRMKQIIDNIPIQNFGDNDYQKGKFTPCWDETNNKIKKTILSETIVNTLQLLLLLFTFALYFAEFTNKR